MTYNDDNPKIIGILSAYPEKVKYLKYSQLEEFYYLSLQEMNRITKAISGEAELKYRNNETSGVHIDIDGSLYYYDVNIDGTYGIKDIKKYDEVYEEVYNEGITNSNSKDTTTSS